MSMPFDDGDGEGEGEGDVGRPDVRLRQRVASRQINWDRVARSSREGV